MSVKRLHEYVKLLKGRHLIDAIHWVQCLCRPSARRILQLLTTIRLVVQRKGWDVSRVYLKDLSAEKKGSIKTVRIVRSPGSPIRMETRQSGLRVRVFELPLASFFQRCYVAGRTPRCIVMWMRRLVAERRVDESHARKIWQPYYSSSSRHAHNEELQRLMHVGELKYENLRDAWMKSYSRNLSEWKTFMRMRASTGASQAVTSPVNVVNVDNLEDA